MKPAKNTSVLLLLVVIATSSLLLAGTERFDSAMQPILEEYLKIHETLTQDKIDGATRAAAQIVILSKALDAETVTGEHQGDFKDLPTKIKRAAQDLEKQKDIGPMREAFKALSKPMAMWASMSRPKDVYVMYCPMAKSSWLQKDKAIRNPYQGQEMLTCGEIVEGQ